MKRFGRAARPELRRRIGRARTCACWGVLLGSMLALGTLPAAGQGSSGKGDEQTVTSNSGEPGGEARFTGPMLPPDHWAVLALKRVEALGLVEGYLPAQRAVPLSVASRALDEAAHTAVTKMPALAELTAEWHVRLQREFSGLAAAESPSSPGLGMLSARFGVGVGYREGAAAPGIGEYEPERSGALPLPDRTRLLSSGGLALRWGRHLSLGAEVEADPDEYHVVSLELASAWGPVRASVGRVPIGYGYGFGGGVTLSGDVGVDVVQVATREPIRLPWLLRALGPVTFQAFGGSMREDRHPDDPYFWGASGQFQPHRRLTFSVQRAAFFGGGDETVTFAKVLNMLIGDTSGIGFEDQVVSASGRFILPTESTLPLTVYLEWGGEDSAGAWGDVPGMVGGILSPSLPFAPEVSAGVEFAHFATSCCGNPKWYRHWSFVGSWASHDTTLGHPLGGDGDELLVHASADLLDGDLWVRGRAFRRDRREENLYSPGRTGVSHGAAVTLELRPLGGTELRLDASHERGEGWTETKLKIEGREFF